MKVERRSVRAPQYSVCIPQHNRTSFVIEVCRSLAAQQFRDFELCISDDCSTDGRQQDLLDYLETSGLSFVYRRLERNGRYDVNLRSAIELASGEYCFLLGNDDVLKDAETLKQLHTAIELHSRPAVVFTNFEDFATGTVTRRVKSTRPIGSGPSAAVGCFRKFSFVSGVLLHRASAQRIATERWDGSEMYQMFVGCRLIAEGGLLLEVDQVTVRKDLQLVGEAVNSYATEDRRPERGIPRQRIPLVQTARLVLDAVSPYLRRQRLRLVLSVLIQYFGFLYPYWLFEYRRVQSWRYAAGVARAMRPRHSLADAEVSALERACASMTYGVATVIGFVLPLWLVRGLHPPARRLARYVGELAITTSRS